MYEAVLRRAEEERRYWEERNRGRFAQIAAMTPRIDYPEARAKLAAETAAQQRRDDHPRRPQR